MRGSSDASTPPLVTIGDTKRLLGPFTQSDNGAGLSERFWTWLTVLVRWTVATTPRLPPEVGAKKRPTATNSIAKRCAQVPADDSGAKKRRRVDISHTAAILLLLVDTVEVRKASAAVGGSIGASGAAAATQQQQGGASSLSAGLTAPMQHPHQQQQQQQPQQQQQQQHPVWYVCAHRGSDFLLRDVLRLRTTCNWARGLFGAPQLWQRLSHSLSTQTGLRRTANGQQLLTFDDQQMGEGDLLAALCVTEAGGWSEMSEAVKLAGQCGNCQLPVRLTAGDLHQYPNKTAYLAALRVLAQLRMVGPHIHFGSGVAFQLFLRGNTLRAIKDQNGYEINIDPPLPPNHLYQQHRQQHDPPVRCGINYSPLSPGGWQSPHSGHYPSVSSCVKSIVIRHFKGTHQANTTNSHSIDRHADNSWMDTLLTQSSHTLVEGCTTTASYRSTTRSTYRRLVLTDASHSFVAWIIV
ncbi:unnamed protein product [Vitrella brassicaformis CCMP3155]|uniref:Uncharacterized protein n=1 Tax=Vitrella brassicaformis (strain CCMP3155) TaxID=1169540 RepID=A0A0G4GND0_VITBC|nr:unnamed protein product [Vitrella brassicaformis CCMP3155]|eukprot:CEM31727.1 unnamed protein product [Vitrella brassicaformis CCMP3155]